MTRYCWQKNVRAEWKEAKVIHDFILEYYTWEQIEDFGSCTALAEDVAYEMDRTEWLDDDNHILWDVVVDVFAQLEAVSRRIDD